MIDDCSLGSIRSLILISRLPKMDNFDSEWFEEKGDYFMDVGDIWICLPYAPSCNNTAYWPFPQSLLNK